MISDAVLKSAAWNIDEDNKSEGGYFSDIKDIDFSIAEEVAIKAVNLYKESKGNINFTFTTNAVYIYDLAEQVVPKNDRVYTRNAVIDLISYRDYVAIYKRFLTDKDLYEKRIDNDNKYAFVNMQAYSMSPETNYVINEENFFSDIYLYYLQDVDMGLAKSMLDKQYLNEIKNTAMLNQNNYYNFSGTATFGKYEAPDYYYGSEYDVKKAYLYLNGVRYSMHIEAGYDVLKNVDKEKFIKALVMVSDSPYASIGARSIRTIERADKNFYDSLNCESNYFMKSNYYKEDGTLFLTDENVVGGKNYVDPYPSLEEMTDYVYKHDPEFTWYFQKYGYNVKYKEDAYDDYIGTYYNYYTINNERANMENGYIS